MARSAVNPLPGYEHAVIEDSKLLDYALNPQSERGQHKAQVFEKALGFNLSNYEQLKQAILSTLSYHEAKSTKETVFGKKYEVRLPITGPNGRTVDLMTVWQFDRQPDGTFSDFPRLVTLYVE